jgi:hypothetical protein
MATRITVGTVNKVSYFNVFCCISIPAGMAELADAADSKNYSMLPATRAKSATAFEISDMTCV